MDMSGDQSSSASHSLLACEVEQRSLGNYSNHWQVSQRRCLEARCRSQTGNRNEILPRTRTLRIGSEKFSKIYVKCLSGKLFYNICVFSISDTFSDGATKTLVLVIERA